MPSGRHLLSELSVRSGRGPVRRGSRAVAGALAVALVAAGCGGTGDARTSGARAGTVRGAAAAEETVPTTDVTTGPAPTSPPETPPTAPPLTAPSGDRTDGPATTAPVPTPTTGPAPTSTPPPTVGADSTEAAVDELTAATGLTDLLARAAGCRGSAALAVRESVAVPVPVGGRIAGLQLAGTVHLTRDTPETVRASVTVAIPSVLAGGTLGGTADGSLTYSCAEGVVGVEATVVRASLAGLFTVRDARLRWGRGDGSWSVTAEVSTPAGRVTELTGRLDVADDAVVGGELDLRRLPLAGLVVVDHLHLTGRPDGTWSGRLDVAHGRSTSTGSVDLALDPDGTVRRGAIDLSTGVELFGVVPLDRFALTWDAANAGWDATLRSTGSAAETATVVLGSRDGALTGADVTLTDAPVAPGLVLERLALTYDATADGETYTGLAAVRLPDAGDARVEGRFRFVDGAFVDGRLVTRQLSATLGTVPVTLDLDARVATGPWRIDGDATVGIGAARAGTPSFTVAGTLRTDVSAPDPVWTVTGAVAVGGTRLGRGEVTVAASGDARFWATFGGAAADGELDHSSIVDLAGRVEGRVGPGGLTATGRARISVLFADTDGAVSLSDRGLVACGPSDGERVGVVWRWSELPEPRTDRCDLGELGGPVPDDLPGAGDAPDPVTPTGRRSPLERRFDTLAGCGRTSAAVVGKPLTDTIEADLTEFGLGTVALTVDAVGAEYLLAEGDVGVPAVLGGGTGRLTVAHRCDRGIVGASVAVRRASLAGLFRIDELSFAWDGQKGTWAATGDVVDPVGHRTRLAGRLTLTDGTVTAGSLEFGGINLAGFVKIRTFRIAFDPATGWTGTIAVDDTTNGTTTTASRGTVDLAFTPDGTLVRGTVAVKKGAALFDVVAVDDFRLAYDAGTTRWDVSLGVRLAGVGGTSFALGTENGGVTGASFTLTDVGIPGVLTVERLSVRYERGLDVETYTGDLTVVVPGTVSSTVGGTVVFTDGRLTRLALAAERVPVVIGGIPAGITLSADVRTAPWRITGTAGIDLGPVQAGWSLVGVRGRVSYRFPTDGPRPDGRTPSGVWDVGGDVLVAGQVLGGGDLTFGDDVPVGIRVRLGAGPEGLTYGGWFAVSGTLEGTVGADSVELAGRGEVTVLGWRNGGRIRINQHGIVACGPSEADADGFVMGWSRWPEVLWGSCSLRRLDAPV